jgi:lysophospholipase L1-like esterase
MDANNAIKWGRIAFATLVFAFLFTEIGVRLFGPTYANTCGLFVGNAENVFSMKPNYSQKIYSNEYTITIDTDELGHRNPKNKIFELGSNRVLFLGDSFAMGLGSSVEETFPSKTESILREKQKSVVVYNGATIGFGTIQEYNELRALAQKFKPTVVIAAFFANDINDNVVLTDVEIFDGCIVWKNERFKEAKNFLRQNSAAYNYFTRIYKSFFTAPLPIESNVTQTIEYFRKISVYSKTLNASPYFLLIPNVNGQTGLEKADLTEFKTISLNLSKNDYYKDDLHFKPKTNEVVARKIVSEISELQ